MQHTDGVDILDMFLVLSVGVMAGFFSEFLSWLFTYRNPDFQKLHQECQLLWKEFYEIEAKCVSGSDNKFLGRESRAAAQVEKKIQKKNKDLSFYRQRGNVIVGFFFMVSMPLLYSVFDGIPAATLPFHPIFPFTLLVQNSAALSSSRLETDIKVSCSATGLFMTTLMVTRMNCQRFLGYATKEGFQQKQNIFTSRGI